LRTAKRLIIMSNKGNEDSLHQPELNMEQQQAIDQATNANLHGEGSNFPTSEVGFGPDQTTSRDVFALLEQ